MEGQFQILFDKMKIEMQHQNAELKDSITKSIMDKMDAKITFFQNGGFLINVNVKKAYSFKKKY